MKLALPALVVGLASAGAVQDLPRLLSPDAKTTATLTGALHDGRNNALDGLTIVLATIGSAPVYNTTTNPDGAFSFEHIRPGLYIVLLKRAEHTVELGRVRLLAGQKIFRAFSKGVVITGTVVDELGAPVPAATVCLLRPASSTGSPRYLRASSATTNARGEFILGERESLPSGGYIAAVMPAGCSTIASPDLVTPRLARYPPMYFPDAPSARDASVVRIDAREDPTFAFRLRPGPTTRLEGKITGYVNTSVVPGQIVLEPPEDEPVSIVRTTRIQRDGSFAFTGLVAGDYRLVLAPHQGPDEPRWAVHNVTLRNEPVMRVPIASQPTVAIGGTVDFAGHLSALYGTRIFLTVNAQRVGGRPEIRGVQPGSFAQVAANGSFGVTGLMPGQYRLSVSGAEAVGWKLRSVTVPTEGSRLPPADAADVPFTVGPNQSLFGLVAHMTYKVTTVTGTIEDPDGQLPARAFAVLFATDPRYWISGSRRIRYMPVGGTGSFRVEGLPDGEYLAVAVRALPAWPDPAWFEAMRPVAVPVTLGDGESREVTLRLRPPATDLPQ